MKTIIERGASWTLEETKMLLALWGQDLVQRQATNTKRTKEVYEKISEKFNQNGFERTADQVRTRVFNMIAEYRRILKDPNPERMKKCIFFEALHKIYQAKHMDDVKNALDDYEPEYPYSPASNTICSEKEGDETISDSEATDGNETTTMINTNANMNTSSHQVNNNTNNNSNNNINDNNNGDSNNNEKESTTTNSSFSSTTPATTNSHSGASFAASNAASGGAAPTKKIKLESPPKSSGQNQSSSNSNSANILSGPSAASSSTNAATNNNSSEVAANSRQSKSSSSSASSSSALPFVSTTIGGQTSSSNLLQQLNSSSTSSSQRHQSLLLPHATTSSSTSSSSSSSTTTAAAAAASGSTPISKLNSSGGGACVGNNTPTYLNINPSKLPIIRTNQLIGHSANGNDSINLNGTQARLPTTAAITSHQLYQAPVNTFDVTSSALLIDRMFAHLSRESENMREWIALEKERLALERARRQQETEREVRRERVLIDTLMRFQEQWLSFLSRLDPRIVENATEQPPELNIPPKEAPTMTTLTTTSTIANSTSSETSQTTNNTINLSQSSSSQPAPATTTDVAASKP